MRGLFRLVPSILLFSPCCCELHLFLSPPCIACCQHVSISNFTRLWCGWLVCCRLSWLCRFILSFWLILRWGFICFLSSGWIIVLCCIFFDRRRLCLFLGGMSYSTSLFFTSRFLLLNALVFLVSPIDLSLCYEHRFFSFRIFSSLFGILFSRFTDLLFCFLHCFFLYWCCRIFFGLSACCYVRVPRLKNLRLMVIFSVCLDLY